MLDTVGRAVPRGRRFRAPSCHRVPIHVWGTLPFRHHEAPTLASVGTGGNSEQRCQELPGHFGLTPTQLRSPSPRLETRRFLPVGVIANVGRPPAPDIVGSMTQCGRIAMPRIGTTPPAGYRATSALSSGLPWMTGSRRASWRARPPRLTPAVRVRDQCATRRRRSARCRSNVPSGSIIDGRSYRSATELRQRRKNRIL